jgi:hypothetical protein
MIDSFLLAFNISFVPREDNSVADSLAILASNFKVPFPPKLKYVVEIKYRPSIPKNVKHWKVFEDDMENFFFLETVDEFSDMHIDQDQDFKESPHTDVFINQIARID